MVKQIVREYPVARRRCEWFKMKPESALEKVVVSYNLLVTVDTVAVFIICRVEVNADILK